MTTSSVHDPLVGHVLDGRYEIIGKVARGGMAMVYKATDRRLARTVAVKVLHEGLGDDPEFLKKFQREARAAAKLSHPNVVAIFDQGMDMNRPYIVMEYVHGQTLRQYLGSHGALPVARVLDLMTPVLAAIAAAHRAGLIHRDIKPENVLISTRGEVKVADFGLAKAISGDTVTTAAGLVIGTVSYIPPEVVTYGPADMRSDVYSAGIMMFELLTGRKPHTGDSPIQVAWAHCNKDVPAPSSIMKTNWHESRHAIPPYVDALVQAATQREPNRRLTHAGVFFDHLRLAQATYNKGIMNDPRVDAEMRRIGGSFAEPTEVMSGIDFPQQHGDGTWHAGPIGITPHTPISPVDLAGSSVPYYDDFDTTSSHRTPTEPSAWATETDSRHTARQPLTPAKAPTLRKERHPLRTVLLAVISLALLCGGGATVWYHAAGKYTDVPMLSGLTRDQAKAAADSHALTIEFLEEYSETVDSGTVIRSNPDAGSSIAKDGHVTAWVSKGAERYLMPTIVGVPVAKAIDAIQASHLSVGTQEKRYDDAAEGTVLQASQEPGVKLKPDTTIDLVISQGPKPIDIADFSGKPLTEVKAAVEAAGLSVNVTEENSDTVAAGTVMSQSPKNGQAKKGDTISFVVSKGPVLVAVPATRGLKTDEASKRLQSAGFQVVTKSTGNAAPFGIVSYSDPGDGKQAPKGSTVTLYIA
ncbi:MAG: Stk1 family PASTA domain-containing Ser/Thr kinase [Propionibacteriaceae bacterium]